MGDNRQRGDGGMKFKVDQRVQIPSRFWNYCGADKTATVVEVDVKCDDPFPYLQDLSRKVGRT